MFRSPLRPLVLAVALVASLSPAAAQAPNQPPPAVTVKTLESQDVTLTSKLPGRVVASGVAEVRPQVDGIIIERLFEEGGDVEVGAPLYHIDPASYEARVAAAKAAVAQAEAQADAADKEYTRQTRLRDRGVASVQSLDNAIASRDAAAAALLVAQAELQHAEINLERTTIQAQLSGVIGRSLTTQGALVTAGQAQPLAVIRKIDPVLVDVTQSAAELIAFRRGAVASRLEDADLTVSLTLADGNTYEETGQLTAAEPYVDEQTGVVTLRLEFPNPERLLLPGMYVQVDMPQAVANDVVLAPQEGVTRDRRGRPLAFIVNSDNVVEERALEVAEARGSDWVVTDGLTAGDRIVIAGLQRIQPGATVRPQEEGAEPAAPQPAAEPDAQGGEAAEPAAGAQADAGDAAPTRHAPGSAAAAEAPARPADEAGDVAAASDADESADDTASALPQPVHSRRLRREREEQAASN